MSNTKNLSTEGHSPTTNKTLTLSITLVSTNKSKEVFSPRISWDKIMTSQSTVNNPTNESNQKMRHALYFY